MNVLLLVLGGLAGLAGTYLLFLMENWPVGFGSVLVVLSVMMIGAAYLSRSVAVLNGR